MKAWVLHDINNIKQEEVKKPVPGDGEALVRVMAAGICGSDIPRIFKTGAHNMPLIPGHEFSGVVEAVGEPDAGVWIGKRVGVFPLIPCRKCAPCQRELYEMCKNYNYLGSRCDGAFAEYVKVPVANLIELPEDVSFQAAAMLEPMAVAVHAMRAMEKQLKAVFDRSDDADVREALMTGAVQKQSLRIAVCGVGTIGLLLCMVLKASGYENITAIGNKEAQRKPAMDAGAKIYCVHNGKSDLPSDFDVFFECVGKNETLSLGVEKLNFHGVLITVGNPYSDMTLDRNTYWKILRNQLTVRGVWNSSFTGHEDDDWHYVLRLLSGHVTSDPADEYVGNKDHDRKNVMDPSVLITHEFSIDDLYHGLTIMRDKTEYYCKVMLSM